MVNHAGVWRPTVLFRALIVVGAVTCVGLGWSMVDLAADEGAAWEALALVLLFAGIPQVLVLRFAARSRVIVGDDRLTIVTIFNEHNIQWTDVVTATPGYNGMTVHLRDGSSRLAGAVQKSDISIWLNRRTRADELVDVIRTRAATAHD